MCRAETKKFEFDLDEKRRASTLRRESHVKQTSHQLFSHRSGAHAVFGENWPCKVSVHARQKAFLRDTLLKIPRKRKRKKRSTRERKEKKQKTSALNNTCTCNRYRKGLVARVQWILIKGIAKSSLHAHIHLGWINTKARRMTLIVSVTGVMNNAVRGCWVVGAEYVCMCLHV